MMEIAEEAKSTSEPQASSRSVKSAKNRPLSVTISKKEEIIHQDELKYLKQGPSAEHNQIIDTPRQENPLNSDREHYQRVDNVYSSELVKSNSKQVLR